VACFDVLCEERAPKERGFFRRRTGTGISLASRSCDCGTPSCVQRDETSGCKRGCKEGVTRKESVEGGAPCFLAFDSVPGRVEERRGLVGGGLVWKMASNGSVELAFSNGLGDQNITKCIFGVNGAPNTP